MHYIHTNETHEEKVKWEPHKYPTCCFEQIPEATLHKNAAVCPLISHLTINLSYLVGWLGFMAYQLLLVI